MRVVPVSIAAYAAVSEGRDMEVPCTVRAITLLFIQIWPTCIAAANALTTHCLKPVRF